MSFLDRALGLADRVRAPRTAHAHCDIPCGIYDPHAAQLAALTVIRMNQLVDALPLPAQGASKAEVDQYAQKVARYTAVKEEHAKICEHELVILWTDYFKPEHVEKHPKLHEVLWNTTRLTSTVKQEVTSVEAAQKAAQQLLEGTKEVARIFWDTKGVQTRLQPANQGAVGGELVYPVA
jgi:nickel superoxide dismutase